MQQSDGERLLKEFERIRVGEHTREELVIWEQLTDKEASSSYELWRPLLDGGKHLFRTSGCIVHVLHSTA